MDDPECAESRAGLSPSDVRELLVPISGRDKYTLRLVSVVEDLFYLPHPRTGASSLGLTPSSLEGTSRSGALPSPCRSPAPSRFDAHESS